MRIKRLQLVGFKSCMEKTVLDFPLGITGIVGPNGCGKSNIVDALRWVLGEQSAKLLRGQTMEDVIFAGNDRYAPLGAAEVTVTFDNEGMLADGLSETAEELSAVTKQLHAAAEIEVTRRLFRSGESEYLINGRSCRLKDITELFLGTGIGTKAYAIIEQGRVGQIVGARPEELRLFIEEAAGTTLYRSRKLAAERKIERTRNNLLRLSDIIHELERQAASLKRQARGALRYKELKEEEVALDKRLTANRLRKIAKRISAMESGLAQVQLRDEEVRGSVAEAARSREAVREQLMAVEERTELARKALYDARGNLVKREQERVYLDDRRAELQRLREEARGEIEEIGLKQEAASGQEAEITRAQVEIERQYKAAMTGKAERERKIAEIEVRLSQTRDALEELKDETVAILSRQAVLENERAALKRDCESATARQHRLDEEYQSLRTVAGRLGQHVGKCRDRIEEICREMEEAAGGKAALAEQLSATLAHKTDRERRAQVLRNDVAGLESRYASLKELHESFVGYAEGVRAFLSNGAMESTGARAVVADVIDIEPGYERAVAAVLADQLQYVVVPSPDAGVAGAAYLKDSGQGRASFIPLKPRPLPRTEGRSPTGSSLLSEHVRVKAGFASVVSTLMADVVVAESLALATEEWKRNGHRATFVTREGEVVDAVGVVTGGSGRPVDEEILARKAELRELAADLVATQRGARSAEQDLLAVSKEADELGGQLAGLDCRLHELTVEKVSAEGDLELQRQNLARTRDRVEAIAGELKAVREEQAGHKGRLREVAAEIEEVSVVHKDHEHRRLGLETERDHLAALHRECSQWVAERSVEEAELRQKRQACDMRRVGLQSSVADLDRRRKVLESRLKRDQTELHSVISRRQDPALDLDQARSIVARSEADFQGVRQECRRLREEQRLLQSRLDCLAAELEQVREHKGRLEVAAKECDLERQALDEGARERLGLAGDELAALEQGDVEDPESLAGQLSQIRERLGRLGNVNIQAVAELEEIESRLAEMTAQRDDLEQSIEDLRGTIARLNRLSRKRFRETFEAVNRIFQGIFPKLFHGGSARLVLSDEQKLLETGVEIFVQPPGKKLGNLSLLSGGEKAMTAVSLIFSLFLHRPSPFCVLDEVDAPLDDANIGRFAKIVLDMCSRSQFVIITHNRRTMECCDMLYGVTMTEPGLSKIVSVELPQSRPTALALSVPGEAMHSPA